MSIATRISVCVNILISFKLVHLFIRCICKIAEVTVIFIMSVRLFICLHGTAQLQQIFVKFYIWGFFKYLLKRFQFWLKSDKKMGSSHEHLCTFMIIFGWIVLRMRNYKGCSENQNTHFIFSKFFIPKNHAIYEMTWKRMVQAHSLCIMDE